MSRNQERWNKQKDDMDDLRFSQNEKGVVKSVSANKLKSHKIQEEASDKYHIKCCTLVETLLPSAVPEGAKVHKQANGNLAYESWDNMILNTKEFQNMKKTGYMNRYTEVKILHDPTFAPKTKSAVK